MSTECRTPVWPHSSVAGQKKALFGDQNLSIMSSKPTKVKEIFFIFCGQRFATRVAMLTGKCTGSLQHF